MTDEEDKEAIDLIEGVDLNENQENEQLSDEELNSIEIDTLNEGYDDKDSLFSQVGLKEDNFDQLDEDESDFISSRQEENSEEDSEL